jgi:hypothetical protein
MKILYIYRVNESILRIGFELSTFTIIEIMKRLEIAKKINTPSIVFDADKGHLKIEGRSIPENPGEFYDELIDWVKEYFKNPKEFTTFDLNLEYVNSGSSKYLLGLFRIIKDETALGKNVTINWYYEEDDEAILSLGEHYKSSLKIPFNLIEYI